jgi:glycosyltransferase involved in cell wall biosynthesis
MRSTPIVGPATVWRLFLSAVVEAEVQKDGRLIADDQESRHPSRIQAIHADHSGYAHAVREGLKEVGAPWVIIIDGDRECPARYIPQLLERRDIADLILTRRIEKPYGSRRRLLSWLYNRTVRMAFSCPFADVGSGLRHFRTDTVHVDESISESAFIAAETPILAVMRGSSRHPVPVHPELNRPGFCS